MDQETLDQVAKYQDMLKTCDDSTRSYIQACLNRALDLLEQDEWGN